MHYRRAIAPGATYFFTINLLNRKNTILLSQIDKLRLVFYKIKKLHPFKIDGIVIMPDHLHMMITLPPDEANFSLRIRLIKSSFSYQINSNELDYGNHLDYIHYNPVKHGYVASAVQWPYSIIHKYIKSGVLPIDWACEKDFKTSIRRVIKKHVGSMQPNITLINRIKSNTIQSFLLLLLSP